MSSPEREPQAGLPIILLALAFTVMVAFQTVQLLRERGNLEAIRAGQETPVQETVKLRDTAQALAGETAQLADSGDAGAKQAIEELRRRGITLKAPAAR